MSQNALFFEKEIAVRVMLQFDCLSVGELDLKKYKSTLFLSQRSSSSCGAGARSFNSN